MKVIQIKGKSYSGYSNQHRATCRGIVIKDGNILLSYAKNIDVYGIPGGGIEANESKEECVIREALEETGYITKVKSMFLEIDEYYGNWYFDTYYFVLEIVGQGEVKYTKKEIEFGLESLWLPLSKAKDIFSKHPEYENVYEEKRGIYLREYTALKNLPLENKYKRKSKKHFANFEMTSEDIDMFNEKKLEERKQKNICDTHIDGA